MSAKHAWRSVEECQRMLRQTKMTTRRPEEKVPNGTDYQHRCSSTWLRTTRDTQHLVDTSSHPQVDVCIYRRRPRTLDQARNCNVRQARATQTIYPPTSRRKATESLCDTRGKSGWKAYMTSSSEVPSKVTGKIDVQKNSRWVNGVSCATRLPTPTKMLHGS